MSKKARRGMHIRIGWPILRLGVPEDFSNAESLTLHISRVNNNVKTFIPDTHMSIADNVVSFIVTSEMQKALTSGEYKATISYRKVSATSPTLWEPYVLDKPCFTLVDSSEDLGGTTDGMEVITIELDGEIGLPKEALPGASAYQIAVAHGFEGDEAEWLYSLKKPALDAATAAAMAANAANDAAAGADAATSELNTVMQLLAQSESGRVQAEQGRTEAEQSRKTAENARTQAEQDRGTTFTQKIEEAEQATDAANAAANAQNAYNVTVAVPLTAGVYYTKTTARAAVPVASRKIGLVNTYALSASTWYTEKYIGSNVSGWATEANWEQVPDAAKLAQFESDLNTKKSIVSADDDHYRLINLIGLQTGYAGYIGNYTLHGFEYTPEQNDDIVTLIGNTNYNTNKPIQSQMRPFEELISTKERFYLRDDVTKRIDGSASNLTDPNYLQKVYIPEFWYGAMFDSVRNKIQLWFSLIPVTGFMHIAPQAACRYPGYIDGTGKARSHSGYKYPNNKNLIEFTAACQLTSEDLFVLPYYTYNALSLLLLHDIGRRNAQAVWAGLQSGATYSNITSGKTDVLITPSGEVPADAETASNKPFRWRFIENLYGDCWKTLSGVYLNQVGAERRVMICPDPYKANTSSVISSDYIQACVIAAGEGWLNDVNIPWINAKSYGASSTTRYCDYTYNNVTDKNILIAGGSSYIGALAGPFSLHSYNSASARSISSGSLFASIDQDKASTQNVKPVLIY